MLFHEAFAFHSVLCAQKHTYWPTKKHSCCLFPWNVDAFLSIAAVLFPKKLWTAYPFGFSRMGTLIFPHLQWNTSAHPFNSNHYFKRHESRDGHMKQHALKLNTQGIGLFHYWCKYTLVFLGLQQLESVLREHWTPWKSPDYQSDIKLSLSHCSWEYQQCSKREIYGAVLLQEDKEGIDHPIFSVSKKCNKHWLNPRSFLCTEFLCTTWALWDGTVLKGS